ncbi:unnamed protein product [Angiostrongylus costaricensis]|uniref:Gamma-glutamyltranspeptidase 1 n=1 Tax=Angiostrongylus costaricensis TaxID=334426 RepID=A0A0R3PHE9_ANGCS|nr:unnamed protein product [Angiostrongylus costaricensis]
MPSVYLVGRGGSLGIPISRDFGGAIKDRFNEIISEKSMITTYNVLLSEGDVFVDHVHSEFLRRLSLSRDPVEMFHRGEVAYQIVYEMKDRGGLLTKLDLAGYEATVERAQETVLPNGFILKGPQSPSAFLAISLIVEIMMSDPDFMPDEPIVNNLRLHHNETTGFLSEEADVTNMMKNLNDQSQSSVGSHINVIDRDGLAVSLSSSLNSKFGSIRRSPRGGFVWNNDMSAFNILDDEDAEEEHVNGVAGRKRPRTSMAPFMLFDDRGQLLSSFGITGSVNSILAGAQVLLNNILFNMVSFRIHGSHSS